MQELRTGGQGLFEVNIKGVKFWQSFLAGVGIIILTVFVIWLDMSLGPKFLVAQAHGHDVVVNSWTRWIPWIYSLATTGLLYAMWQEKDEAKSEEAKKLRWIITLIAGAIALADTASDAAGYSAWRLADPLAGVNILPPADSSSMHKWLTLATAAICFGHEPFLNSILGRFQHGVNEEEGEGWSERLKAGLVYLSGVIFNIVRSVTIWFGTFAMLILDLVLILQLTEDGESKIPTAIVSFTLTFAQIGIWQLYSHLKKHGETWKTVTGRTRWVLLGAVGFMIGDTLLDMSGFNNLFYGTSSFFIDNPTWAWFLNFLPVGLMCTFNEAFADQIFANIKAGPVGGAAVVDFGGGFGGGDDEDDIWSANMHG